MPESTWGKTIARLLAERGWTKRQLASAAGVQPNTITNLLTHGRDSDTATLTRIADALGVDIAELFLSREQSLILEAHQEDQVERLKNKVFDELSATITRLVREELGEESAWNRRPAASEPPARPRKRPPRGKKR